MLVHPDPSMEGKNELDLKDINGKPIIRGLIGAATTFPGKRTAGTTTSGRFWVSRGLRVGAEE
jgi:hypothetical protein